MKMNPIVMMAVLGLALVAGCSGKKSPAKECQSGFLLDGNGVCVADPCTLSAASACTGCQGKSDGSYTCQGCSNGKDPASKCADCPAGQWLQQGVCVDPCVSAAASQCSGCQGTADGGFTCQGCLNGKDPVFKCADCPSGMLLKQGVCVADPCASAAASQCSGCQGTADGSFTCQGCLNGKDPAFKCADCPSGRWLYQGSCIADPCLPSLAANCASCTPTAPDQYLCNACKSGYSVSNNVCVDVDECALGTNDCGSLPCYNIIGSFRCGCADGQVRIFNPNKCVDPEWAYWSMKKTVPSPRFTLPDADSDHYDDALTGLQWKKVDLDFTKDWESAKQACTALGGGWRLPTVIELNSIADYTKTDPLVTDLAGIQAAAYWSSTPYDSSESNAWSVFMAIGSAHGDVVYFHSWARCVR